jgi:MFS family permease
MLLIEKSVSAIAAGINFVRRQDRDWKITVARSSLSMFVYQMVFPYISVYTLALGATATELGIVNSLGMGLAGLIGPFVGWTIDSYGVKRVYLVGIGLLATSYLVYGTARSWHIAVFAMLAYWLGKTASEVSCSVICANALASKDRATGMSLCETVAAGLLGIAAPLLGAFLVGQFGGVGVSGIRPVFFVCLAGTLATFFLIFWKLSNRRWGARGATGPKAFWRELATVLKERPRLRRWIVISSLNFLPMGMILPFTQPFAHLVKGADEFILGAMVTGFAVTPLVFGVFIGRLADKIGRKRVLYFITPLSWISSLLLIYAPSGGVLVLAGILQGFYFVSSVVSGAMTFELMSPQQMGKWLGILCLFRMCLAACAAYVAGAIWDNVGPQYVFLAVIGLDLLIRMPLLISMPETLMMEEQG